ncbi:MAG: ABC transporter permease [Blautia sp.]|nr:ABC transporter permease [Blautia sp.]MCM1201275.1 ABC transporter permease [Bacteroides fragilis]
MEIKTLWLAFSRRHRGSLAGIFILILLLSLTLLSALTVWRNAGDYVHGEMKRLGFGEITAWVSGVPDIERLADGIDALPETGQTGIQPVIFSEYEVNGQQSDSEGQLITYEPEKYPYKIFTEDMARYRIGSAEIGPGEIYVSPSMQSMFGIEIGDEIRFRIARNSVEKSFVVKGWFEDPFMGSSMIGMKGFLICRQDHDEIAGIIAGAGIDGLARDGYMLHIFQEISGGLSASELNAALNNSTEFTQYVEFTHSDSAIAGFMLTLQNVFTGLFLAFALVLLMVSLVVLGHSISSSLEQDRTDTGILKTIGFTTGKLQKIQMFLFLSPVLWGMTVGVLSALPAVQMISRMTLTTTGLLIPSGLSMGSCLLALLTVLCLLTVFILLKTAGIEKVTPMEEIRREDRKESGRKSRFSPVYQRGFGFWLALRQIFMGRMRYMGVCLVALFLTFFVSLIGRMDAWLGPDGKGLMDAFNPSDLHIAAQPVGETTNEDVEQMIRSYTDITDRYMLAMPNVTVEGVDYTANVITEPERFHLLEGKTCTGDDEIVLTEFVAADLDAGIGDTVLVSAGLGASAYKVSGIYQCANDMGANVGLSREGYRKIGKETSNMWCTHYFLEDAGRQAEVMQALDEAYGGDVYLHENSWPGLYGILSAMDLLMYFMYGITAVVILVITALTGSRLLVMEQKDLGIYRTLGLPYGRLRISFALRFGIVSMMGAVAGMIFSAWFTDPLVAALLRLFGISNFISGQTLGNMLLPVLVITGLFSVFSWLVAGRMKTGKLAAFILMQG